MEFYCPTKEPEDVIPHLAKGIRHWRKDYSAYELAYAWWGANGIPRNVRTVLDDCRSYRGAELINAFFERKTGLGDVGRPSQTDLLIHARCSTGFAVIAVEGKAGEPFGEVVGVWRSRDPSNRKEERLHRIRDLLGISEDCANRLRYQLLHRTVAAIKEAQRYGWSQALMLVHHFANDASADDPSFTDFQVFAHSIGIDAVQQNKISNAQTFDGIELSIGWISDRPSPDLLPG